MIGCPAPITILFVGRKSPEVDAIGPFVCDILEEPMELPEKCVVFLGFASAN